MINIPAILIADGMGLTILFVVAIGNIWRLKEMSKENRCLLIMFLCCVSNCIMDPICFIVDGKVGLIYQILAMACNSILYLGGAMTAMAWVFLIAYHLQNKLGRTHRTILFSIFGVLVLMVVINFFVPIMFSLNEKNEYNREFGYGVYIACYIIFMLDGLILYFQNKYSSGGLKFFPVWAFLIPATIGMICQTKFYGISTTIPFTTVSIVCMIICLQNEFMLRDKLTGLYNRFYLDTVEKRLERYTNLHPTAIFLDINEFKSINDTYGHNVGDQALINLSSILLESVGRLGEVVRYAGDEFIIILNSQDQERIDGIITEIQNRLNEFNDKNEAPYNLSIAIGCYKLDLLENTLSACIDKVDKLMYKNKREYYLTHSKGDKKYYYTDTKE